MDKKKFSIEEMLEMTVQTIGEIQVPVAYADQISRPLCQAIGNLRGVIEAIRETEGSAEEQEGEQDGEGKGV